MYFIRFIQNWNGSELTDVGGGTYTTATLKDTSVLSDGIKLISDDMVSFDPEQYMGDDFFVSEPREAKLQFLLDDDGWLKDRFLYSNEAEEINYVLFLNEAGTILTYDDTVNPYNYNIGDKLPGYTSDNDKIFSKEVLVQQFSKYLVEIWERFAGSDDVQRFVGLVDKSQTKCDDRTITIECIDFIKLVKLFGEQLIKVIITTENEGYYQYIISPNIVDELLDKIKNFTKLEIEVDNDISNYGNGEVTNNNNNLDIDNYLITWYVPYGGYNEDLTIYQDIAIMASDYYKAFIIYKCYLWSRTYEEEGQYGEIYFVTEYHFTVREHRWTQDIGVSATIYITDYILSNHLGQYDPAYVGIGADAKLETYLNSRLETQAFVDTDGLVNYIELNSNGNYDIIQIEQERYSIAIPIKADTHTYLKLLRTILYLNILTMYVDRMGILTLKSKENLDNDSQVIEISDRDIIKDGVSLTAVERDDSRLSDALDIVWYDYEASGEEYGNLDNVMKNIYANIFINKYPLEFKGKIKRVSVETFADNLIVLGTVLYMLGSGWVIVQCKLNNTRSYWDIKAYKIKAWIYVCLNGTATADSSHSEPHTADKAFDRDNTTSWASDNAGYPHWVKYNLGSGSPQIVRKYIVTIWQYPLYRPVDWKLQGSNNDADWDDLDEKIGYEWTDYVNYVSKAITEINNDTSYQYYRLYITRVATTVYNMAGIHELEFYKGG